MHGTTNIKNCLYLVTALHVSGGICTHRQEHIQLSTASGICQTFTATCHFRGSVSPTLPR